MNTYFNFTNPVQPGDRLDSVQYNQDFSGVERAFDALPSPEALATNTGTYAVSKGTGTAYSCTLVRFDGSFGYLTGMQVLLRIHLTNTGPATLNVNGIGARPLVNLTTGLGPLVAGDLTAGTIYSIRYDGTQFQVANTTSGAIAATQTAATQASASATAAAGSATAAAGSASAAASSASAAAGSASSASTNATAAAGSATAAANSQTAAAGSASSASTSATNAAASASAAAGSASSASSRATAAAGSASSASTNATAAAASATAANNSATAAANSAATATAALSSAEFKNAVLDVLKTTTLDVGVVKFYAINIDPNTKYPGTTWQRLPVSQSIRTSLATAADVMTTVGSDTATLLAANIPSHNHTGTATIASTDLGTKTSSAFDYGTKTSSAFDYGTITTSSFDYGTQTSSSYDFAAVTSSSAGAHSHTVAIRSGGVSANLTDWSGRTSETGTPFSTSTDGAHTHSWDIPAHSHTVAMGAHTHSYALGSHTHTVVMGSHTHTVVMGAHGHTASISVDNFGSGSTFNVVNLSLILVAWYRSA